MQTKKNITRKSPTKRGSTKKGNKTKKIVKWLWVVAMTPVALLVLMLSLTALGVFGRMPSFEELENPKSNLATEVYADNGQVNIKDNKSSKTGVFDLIDLDVKWDDQSLFDVRQIMIDLGEIYNLEEDFDVSNFIWGKSTETGKHILCGI